METHDTPSAFAFVNSHPSSPPMTPGAPSHRHFKPSTSHISPTSKRMGVPRFTQSPPLEYIDPIGQGPRFHFTRPQSVEPTSRPSTASGRPCAATPQDSEYEGESDEDSENEVPRPVYRIVEADFVIEELGSDPGYDSDIEVVLPDHYEDAKSDKSGIKLVETGFLDKFKELHCQEGSSDEEERERIYRRKKKRWSAGVFKRSHSQSVEGDSSYSDNDPLDDVDGTRRLRRRVRGPGDRSSLIFEDKGFSNANHIVEVEEPDEGGIMHSKGPPSIPSDDAFTLDELPFWEVEEEMEIEFDSS